MSYSDRIKNIIDILFNGSGYVTLDLIAQRTGYSKRSVQNYLSDIDSWIIKNGLLHTKTVRKQGKGITIEADAADRLKIEKLLAGKSFSIYGDDNKRRLEIIKKLIVLENEITVRSLTGLFYVSRSTILSDLEWIREWLSPYKFELHIYSQRGQTGSDTPQRRRGITVSGSEFSHRNAIAGYFDLYMSMETGAEISTENRGRLHDKRLQDLMDIYPADTVEKVDNIIESSEKKFGFFLTDDYYTSLLTHLVISVSRFINGNTVSPEFAPPDDEEFPAYIQKTAEFIAGLLETVFCIKVSDMERAYICIHLVGFNALSAEQSVSAETPEKIKYLALELIKAVDSRLGARFISDELLFFGLCMHLKSKVFRLQKDVYHKRTSLYQLSNSDIAVYNAVSSAGGLFYDICGVEPDEEELLNITCYLLLSLHRNRSRPKALLICNEGIIERLELMSALGNEIPSIDIADCSTTYQLGFQAIGEYDFIISTEPLEHPEIPIVDLSATARSGYPAYIQNFINNIR